MDLTMCCTNELKAHIWHEKNTRECWAKKNGNTIYTCCRTRRGGMKIWWGVKARGRKAKGKTKTWQNSSNSRRNANKKWEMPRLFPNKVKGSFQHNCSMFASRKIFSRFSAFVFLLASQASKRAKPAVKLCVVEAWQRKKITQSSYFILQ